MNIIGIGVDIVDNYRIKASIVNKKFLEKIYSKEEIINSKNIANKVGYYSKRFAAKEAFSKALGTGFRFGLNFKDISVINDKKGKPFIKINNKVKLLIKKKYKVKNTNILMSISDEKKHSIAFVIIEKK